MRGWCGTLVLAAMIATGCSSDVGEAEVPVGEGEDVADDSSAETTGPGKAGAEDTALTDKAAAAADDADRPSGRIVDCIIVTNSDHFDGPCRFMADSDGSFSLSLDDESPIVDAVTMVSLAIVEPGHADVRGLTTDGINSRWGEAMRDVEDRACWNGSDFTICAY